MLIVSHARMKSLLIVVGVMAAAAPVPAARAQDAPLRGFDAYVEQALRDWRVPGVAIAVVRNDSVVFVKGYGVRELGKPARVDAHTLFAIGSTTKAFTAAALAMLVDSGKLAWDDPVTKHLAWLELADPYVTRELTVRDLLTHRSGLPRGDLVWYGSSFDRSEVLHRVRYLKPRWSFRSNYGYQNIMFLAAGEVVAAASGVSWGDFLKARIFTPLGMTGTNTSVTALAGEGDVAMPHKKIDDTVRVIPWRNIDNVGPAGSINSSVADLSQWLRLQLGGGTFRGRRLVSDSTVEEMHTPQMVIRMNKDAREIFPDTHFLAYGLGWLLRDYHGKMFVGHGGAIDGMRAEIGLVPEARVGAVVLCNLDGTSFPAAILYRALDAYLGAPPRDWSAVLLAAERKAEAHGDSVDKAFEAKRVRDTHPSLPLERYAGNYVDSLYGTVEIAEQGDRLVARMGPAFTGDLTHWHFDTFKVTWRDRGLGTSYLTFNVDADGKVGSVEVREVGEFKRSAPPPTRQAGR
ncbi:MAG: serine hydrolase [Gemmatimonadetes bacterium]|nr:MAG: serine hydrolase [Gemmatimonadota bacterium]